jgi:hypothetical protein
VCEDGILLEPLECVTAALRIEDTNLQIIEPNGLFAHSVHTKARPTRLYTDQDRWLKGKLRANHNAVGGKIEATKTGASAVTSDLAIQGGPAKEFIINAH